MSTLSRRDVLKVAGAAGVVPLLGAGRGRRHRGTCVSHEIAGYPAPGGGYSAPGDSFSDLCDLIVIGEDLTVNINGKPYTGKGGGPKGNKSTRAYPVVYVSDAGGTNWISSAPPLAPIEADGRTHLQLWVPMTVSIMGTSYTFSKHEFTIQIVSTKRPVGFDHNVVQVLCLPLYTGAPTPQTISCCYLCGNNEYCIAKGNCIMCGAVQHCC